jgi:WD40 repeat protein
VNPYRGLAPFEESDAEAFFGRDNEIDELVERLESRRLLAVIGVSGCGKSSLIRAGLVPVLRMGMAYGSSSHWRIQILTPGRAPLRSLRTALEADADWPKLSFDLVDQARQILHPNESLLLVVDQFEEIFHFRKETLEQDGGNEAALFVNLLLNAVDQREAPIYVVLAMRTDFLGECAQFRGLPEALNYCYYLVPRMTRLQQQEAIERPLQKQEVSMQPALVQRLLNDSAEDPDHLPVLQHLLKRLWESWEGRDGQGPISGVDYEATGGWRNALGNDAEAVFERFPREQEAIRLLFQWITDGSAGEKPVRRPRPFLECAAVAGLERERLLEVIDEFQNRGLLRFPDHNEQSLVDLQHESVVWQWPRLKGWILEETESAAQLRFLLQSARLEMPLTGLALESALRYRAMLWEGSRIAQRYLSAEGVAMVGLWVDESERRRVEQETAVQLQREQARLSAEARELSAWAALSGAEDPERSLILGLYAWGKQRAMVPGLEQFLHGAVLESQSRLTLPHASTVLAVAWSPDGARIATASDDNIVTVWQADSGKKVVSLGGHQSSILDLAWSPGGDRLATASFDGTAKVWDVDKAAAVTTFSGHSDKLWSIGWSPDGSKIATSSSDGTAKVWIAVSGSEILTLGGHQGAVLTVAWAPEGDRLATGGEDFVAIVWEARTGIRQATLMAHQGAVRGVAWSPDGVKLATCSEDTTVMVWQMETEQAQVYRAHIGAVWSLAWSPDGTRLATASFDGTAKVWEAGSGRELSTLRGHQGYIVSVEWSPDGSMLATASFDGMAKVWETGYGREVMSLRGHRGYICDISWAPDGLRAATGSFDNTAKVWRVKSGEDLMTLRGHQNAVQCCAWSPDGVRVATASDDHTARIWDSETGRELMVLKGHEGFLRSIVWSPDGALLATASNDSTARIWNSSSGQCVRTISGHTNWVRSLAWSPDGTMLATTSYDGTVKIWDAGSGVEKRTFSSRPEAVLSVAWSPDGSRIAAASFDKIADVWDVLSGEILVSLRGHRDSVVSIAWSPDGSRLATASSDRTVKVWEAGTGRELLTLRGHHGGVLSVDWSPDGRLLASAGADGLAQIYAIAQDDLLRLVRSRITRELTAEECRRYLSSEQCPPLPEVP